MVDYEAKDIGDPDPPAPEQPAGMEPVEDDHTQPNRRRQAFLIIAALIVLLALVIGFLIWRRSSTTPEETEEVVVSVKVAKAVKDSIAKEVSAVGMVVPTERADVAASISAQIRQMGLLKNSLVKRGDPIAVLSSDDLIAQRNEAQAAVEEARLNLQTVQKVQIPQAAAQSNQGRNRYQSYR
jgi:multidrug efflux pump subunit AcrA (membrane-fusion protein)